MISHRKTIYLGEDKMLNSDLNGVAMEACEELLNGIDKLKIPQKRLEYLQNHCPPEKNNSFLGNLKDFIGWTLNYTKYLIEHHGAIERYNIKNFNK